MALTITESTTGYDKSGITALLNKIHADVIIKASDQMKSEKEKLKEKVDEIWQGHSAKIFKENLDTDVDNICKALDATYGALVSELRQIQDAMGQVDQELVERR